MIAVMNRNREFCELLLDSGAEIDALGKVGKRRSSVLQLACQVCDPDLVSMLAKRGASLSLRDADGLSCTMRALNDGKHPSSTVRTLLKLGASTDGQRRCDRMNALHLAALSGHIGAMNALLEYGADVNGKDRYGRTPLHIAAKCGYVDVVSLLIDEYNADPDVRDRSGSTALHVAASHLCVELLGSLLDRGIPIDSRDSRERTPLMRACAGNRDQHGVHHGKKSAVEALNVTYCLIDRGADVNAKSKRGLAPIHFAAACGRTDVTLGLLTSGAKIDRRSNDGKTALHLAAANGKSSTVSLLLDRGASAICTDARNRSPLYYAARHGHIRCVKILSQCKYSSTKQRQNDVCRSIKVASRAGHQKIVEYLLSLCDFTVDFVDRYLGVCEQSDCWSNGSAQESCSDVCRRKEVDESTRLLFDADGKDEKTRIRRSRPRNGKSCSDCFDDNKLKCFVVCDMQKHRAKLSAQHSKLRPG